MRTRGVHQLAVERASRKDRGPSSQCQASSSRLSRSHGRLFTALGTKTEVPPMMSPLLPSRSRARLLRSAEFAVRLGASTPQSAHRQIFAGSGGFAGTLTDTDAGVKRARFQIIRSVFDQLCGRISVLGCFGPYLLRTHIIGPWIYSNACGQPDLQEAPERSPDRCPARTPIPVRPG